MLTKTTKGRQVSIPSEFRKELEIEEDTLLEMDLSERKDALILKPLKTGIYGVFGILGKETPSLPEKGLKTAEKDYIGIRGIPPGL